MLDRQNCHAIQCRLEAVEGEISAGAEVDREFAKIAVVLYRPVDHGRVLKRQECFTDGEILQGDLPRAKMKLVQAWLEIHREDPVADWNLAVQGLPPQRIKPLE